MGGLTYRREEDYFFTTFEDFTLKLYDGYYDDLQTLCRSYLSKYVISQGDIIVDAGAHIGAFCLVVSRLVGTAGKIVAFEPDTINYKRLLNNIRLNKVTNIIPINKGLWSEDAILQFSNGYNGESSFFFDDTKLNSVIPVPVVSLDNELDRLGIES